MVGKNVSHSNDFLISVKYNLWKCVDFIASYKESVINQLPVINCKHTFLTFKYQLNIIIK